jgi:hypothetical protein
MSPRQRRPPPAGVLFATAVATVLACSSGEDDKDDNQFRADVIWCEEAVARLATCCPGFEPMRVECKYYYSHVRSCGPDTMTKVEPAFTTDESRCIIDTPCDALVANDVCRRAQDARAVNTTTHTETGSTTGTVRGPRVCP